MIDFGPDYVLSNRIDYYDNGIHYTSLIATWKDSISGLVLYTNEDNKQVLIQDTKFIGFAYKNRIVTFKDQYLTISEDKDKLVFFIKEIKEMNSIKFKEEDEFILVLAGEGQCCEFNFKTQQSNNWIFSKIENSPPGLLTKISNAATALAKHIKSGMIEVSEEIYNKRLEICVTCPWFGKNWTCNSCGCNVTIKTKWATENCPICKLCNKKREEHKDDSCIFTPKWDKYQLPVIEKKCGGCGL